MEDFDHNFDRLDAFAEWFGDWLGAVEGNFPAYYEPSDWPSGPDRILQHDPTQHGGRVRDAAIWICTNTEHPRYGFRSVAARLAAEVRARPELREFDLLIASPDDLRDEKIDGVIILDAERWLQQWERYESWPEGVSERLKRLLNELPSGGDGFAYQSLVRDIFRFLFFPSLVEPRSESWSLLGSQRRDHLFAFGAGPANIWSHLAQRHIANNLVVDAKSWSSPLPANEVRVFRGYLKPNAPGLLGVLATRIGLSAGAMGEVRDHARDGVAILPIDDATVTRMIDAALHRRLGGQHNGAEDIISHIHAQVFRG